MSDVSTATKLIPTVNEGFSTTLGAGGVLSGGAAVPLTSVTGLTNGTTFVGIIEPGQPKQQVFSGVVDTGGSQITNVVWTRGTNVDHLAGVTIVDYVAGTTINLITKALGIILNQDGSFKTSPSFTTPTITSPTIQGLVDGWTGANESWAYASASTITVPSDATTRYDVGDYVKITQSAVVKYFVVTTVTSTVLTVAGLNGVTVANSAISANAYSKVRNPHGVATYAAGAPYVPIKFSVYRNAALTSSGGPTAMPSDTKLFDTGGNVDIVTNKGRFTAPIPGFYFFGGYHTSSVPGGAAFGAFLVKNNTNVISGTELVQGSTPGFGSLAQASAFVQLAATDYIDFQYYNSGNGFGVGSGQNGFWGYLVSAL